VFQLQRLYTVDLFILKLFKGIVSAAEVM